MPIEMPDKRVREYLSIFEPAAVYVASARMVHRVGAAADLHRVGHRLQAFGVFEIAWAGWVEDMAIAEHLANSTMALRQAKGKPVIYAPNIEGIVNVIQRSADASHIAITPHDTLMRRARQTETNMDRVMEQLTDDGTIKMLKHCFKAEKVRRDIAGERMISYETFMSDVRKEIAHVIFERQTNKAVANSGWIKRLRAVFPWISVGKPNA